MTDRLPTAMEARPQPTTDASIEALLEEAASLIRRAEDDENFDLIEMVRDRLVLDAAVSDVTIAASLAQIGTRSETRERWLAAFGSPLGRHLAARGSDLNLSLDVLLALAPRVHADG